MPGHLGIPVSRLVLHASLVLALAVTTSAGGGGAALASGNRPKKEVANNGPTPSYRLFIKPMRRSSSPQSTRERTSQPPPPSPPHDPLEYDFTEPTSRYLYKYDTKASRVRANSTNVRHASQGESGVYGRRDQVGNTFDQVEEEQYFRVGQESVRQNLDPNAFDEVQQHFDSMLDNSEDPRGASLGMRPVEQRFPHANRSVQWNGRRSMDGDDYSLEEEEVLEGVSMDDPEALLPDPTGPALSILEKRLHHSSIRHRKSRKNFVRTRKSPKLHSRSHNGEYEEPSHRAHVPEPKPEDFEIVWESESVNPHHEDQGLEGIHVPSTATSLPWYSSGAPNLENKFRATGDIPTEDMDNVDEEDDTQENEREGKTTHVDIVTKFLRIVESQHLLGENCTKGTDFNLGEGVVDRYAQERFRLEGEIAVNRANLYTRLWKYSPEQVLASQYLLHAEVLTMVELDEDIFAAGNCYDKYEYEDYLLFCPFAYRLPEGNILVKDLAVEYKYLSNTSEWFYRARKNAERAISNYTTLTKGKSNQIMGKSSNTHT